MSVHTDKFSEEKTGYMPVQLQCFETLSPCTSAIDPPSLVSLVSSGSWVKWNWGSYDHILQVLLGHKHLECLQYGQQQCKCTHTAHFKGPLPGKWFPLFIVLVLVFGMHCVFFRSFFSLCFLKKAALVWRFFPSTFSSRGTSKQFIKKDGHISLKHKFFIFILRFLLCFLRFEHSLSFAFPIAFFSCHFLYWRKQQHWTELFHALT